MICALQYLLIYFWMIILGVGGFPTIRSTEQENHICQSCPFNYAVQPLKTNSVIASIYISLGAGIQAKAGMSIAHFALEMHQFRWVASWLRGGPRMIRTPVTPPLLWSAYVRLDQEDSCTGRRWNEMRLRHGTVATAIIFFTSFLSLSWYTAWQNGKGTEIPVIQLFAFKYLL